MAATEQREVRQRGRAPVRPMMEVMALPERQPAAREAAALVAVVERAPQGRRNRPRPGPDLHGAPVLVVPHHHAARVARQALRRFRGNARAVLEHGLAGLIRIGERRCVDMDHDLVALARRAGIEPVGEGRLRDQGQRVGLLLRHGRALREGIGRRIIEARDHPGPLVQRLAGRGQRLHEQGAHLRLQPPAEHDRAVVVLVDVQRPARVLALGLPRLGLAIDASPAAHDPLDVRGRAAAPHPEQPRFGLRRGDAGQGPDLGVRQLPAGERLGQQRQRRQGARYADLLAGRTEVESDPPAQPVGAGAEPVAPAAAGIELADEVEEARGGGLEMRRQLGDLIAQPVQFRDGSEGRADGVEWISMASLPSTGATLHPGFGAALERSGRAMRKRAMIFRSGLLGRQAPGPCEPLGRHPPSAADTRRATAPALSSGECNGRASLECAEQRALQGLLGVERARLDTLGEAVHSPAS